MTADFPNLRHMRVFLEATRAGSVSEAAARCNLSQPAATQAIAKLEDTLGAPLLLRRTRELTATAEGQVFAARVATALDRLASASRAARRLGGGSRGAFDTQVTAAQLRALVAIAETGSFTVAARALDLSQPTVHRTARNLEAIAGVPLFTATAAGVGLTAAAQVFVQGVKLAQAEIRQGLAELTQLRGQESASFVIGSLPLARTRIVPDAVHRMVTDAPGMQIRVVEGRYSELLRSLREGDLDCMIGALRNPVPADDVVQEKLFDDPLCIVAHPSHPLAQRCHVTVEDTLAYPWVAPPKETPAGQYLYETLRIQDRPETPVRVVASSLVFLRGLLAHGDCVSIISRHQISVEEADGHLVPLPIPLENNARAIGLTFRRDWRPTESQARFIEFLRMQTGTADGASAAAEDRQ
ncbi:LysR family transcriptional regulator [Mesobacterium pallidum]|uniref:LysR family transcriptional regulator n=1 Tax=Mesobacterium pallidum TaxID=2872037 RepID=UPI001EE1F8C1|nr:LysR family transcriptional regulator [Mesobacterium pallidum]